MTTQQKTIFNTARAGLASANKGNPFWSKSDAMQLLNLIRNNARGAK